MQKAKHTPGPWWIGEESEDFGSHTPIHANEWGAVAQVVTEMADQGESAEGIANARLIAAAPDLLRALELVVNSDMAQREEDEGSISTELAHARAAIAKATALEAAA